MSIEYVVFSLKDYIVVLINWKKIRELVEKDPKNNINERFKKIVIK